MARPTSIAIVSLAALLGTGAALAQAGPDAAMLESGRAVLGEIPGLETRNHPITMQAGQFAGITLYHRGIDFSARVLNPDGISISESVKVYRSSGQESADFVAETAGVYHLEIHAPFRGATGKYEIRVAEIRAATEQDRQMQEARSLSVRSSRQQKAGNYGEALALAARAVEISEKESGPQSPIVARFLWELATLYHGRSADHNAEPLFRRALDIDEKILGPEHPQSLSAMRSVGTIYRVAGDYGKAEPLLRQALETTEKSLGREHPAMVGCLVDFSYLHYRQGDLVRAEQELKRAIGIAETTLPDDDSALLHAINNLAVLYNFRKEYDRAEPLLQRVLQADEKSFGPESTELALPLWNLALIAQEKNKDYSRALSLYWRAEALMEKESGPDHWQIGSILNNVANIYKDTGDYAEALKLHSRVHAMWEKSLGPYHGLTLISLGNIARTYASMGDVENAVKFQALTDEAIEKNLALNLAIGSERQKLAYFASLSERTDRTISLQVKLAPDNQTAVRLAALAALQRKGRVLDAMSLNLATLRQQLNPADQALLDDWNAASGQLARLALRGPGLLAPADYQKRLVDMTERRDRAEAAVNRRSAEFGAQSQPVTLDSVEAAIPQNAALVEFAAWRPFNPSAPNTGAYGELRYIVYVLRSQSQVRWKDLGPAKEIDLAVDAFRRSLDDPQRNDVRQLSRALDRKVMEPVRAMIGDARQLLISPEGPLNLIPLQALMDERGRYLLERYSISYLTSGRDLLRMKVARASHGVPVIFADPDFGEPQAVLLSRAAPADPRRSITAGADLKDLYFAPLAATAAEGRAIQSLFPEAHLLTGREATESALKKVDAPEILHIATHGFFLTTGARTGNPLLDSGLALAGANRRAGGGEGGIFTALEASGLQLWGTKLVTLSACDTGIGEVKSGEGVYGLRRSFVLAGAETLVMSLWPVSDYITRETMTAFYTGLKHGLGRGEALRQAQLAILRRKGREHPYFWAGFIQSGEWARLDGRR